jgi:hypothetical protein
MHRTSTRGMALPAAALLLVGCAPELNWREWQSDEAGVRQMFPCKPVRQQRQVQVAGQPLTLVLQVCDAGGASWALSHARVDKPADVNAVMDAMARSAAANLGAKRPAVAAQVVPGATPQPATGVLHISGHLPDGRPMAMSTSLFARGTTVFQATALGPALSRDTVDTFLGSSRVVP